jgi:hypothetical protein
MIQEEEEEEEEELPPTPSPPPPPPPPPWSGKVKKEEEEEEEEEDGWSFLGDLLRVLMHFCWTQKRRFSSDVFQLSVVRRKTQTLPTPSLPLVGVYGRAVNLVWRAHDMREDFREAYSQVVCGPLRSHWRQLQNSLADFDVHVKPLGSLSTFWEVDVALPVPPGRPPVHFCPPKGYLNRAQGESGAQSMPNF